MGYWPILEKVIAESDFVLVVLDARMPEISENKGVLGSIGGDRKKERELQQRIARLIEKEAKLNQRKKLLQTKIDRVSDKMNKISKIRSEMSDL